MFYLVPPGPSRPPLPDFQTLTPQPVLMPGVTLHKVKDSAFSLVEHYEDPASPFFWPVQVPLHGSTMIWPISHSSWLVRPSNLLSVRSAPWSRSLLKLLNLLFSIHCWFWEMNRSRSACQCPCMNGAPLTVLQNSLSHLDCGQTISDGLETASSMNSSGEQLRMKTKAWGFRAGRKNGWLHLSCWRTTEVTYSKRIKILPRISRINWQWTNSQIFQLVFSLWTKVSGGMPDDCEWLWNLPYYLHFLL